MIKNFNFLNYDRILDELDGELFEPALLLKSLGDILVYVERGEEGTEVYALMEKEDKLYVFVYNNPLVSLRVPTKYMRREDLQELANLIYTRIIVFTDVELLQEKFKNVTFNTDIFKEFTQRALEALKTVELYKVTWLERVKGYLNKKDVEESNDNLNNIDIFNKYILKIKEESQYNISIMKTFPKYCLLKDSSGAHYFIDTVLNQVFCESNKENLILKIYSKNVQKDEYSHVLEYLES